GCAAQLRGLRYFSFPRLLCVQMTISLLSTLFFQSSLLTFLMCFISPPPPYSARFSMIWHSEGSGASSRYLPCTSRCVSSYEISPTSRSMIFSKTVLVRLSTSPRERKLWFRLISRPLPPVLKRSDLVMNKDGSAWRNL